MRIFTLTFILPVTYCQNSSAGVGRSGTFIAIDRLLQYIQLGRPVDVFGIVNEMRMERCHMVQNEVRGVYSADFLTAKYLNPQSFNFEHSNTKRLTEQSYFN